MYRNLKVWQDSRVLARRIYSIVAAFPSDEKYELSAQLRRAAVSVVSNIAEGESRQTHRDQCAFYYVARGSLVEVETQLILAADFGFVNIETVNAVLQATAEIGREINGLIRATRTRRSAI